MSPPPAIEPSIKASISFWMKGPNAGTGPIAGTADNTCSSRDKPPTTTHAHTQAHTQAHRHAHAHTHTFKAPISLSLPS
eukprot:5326252-Amphidinium_carterae.2